ncbi:MAG: tRNA 2-thiouridine(34) synthase MnmA [Planctomycetes bacterium]|nr:tRNA 2-thiouridine(34) synthase MnmA [Planctomycetota bacterium]
MSGGVDSSVTAFMLREQGYDVMGLFMRVGAEMPEAPTCETNSETPQRTHQGCCSASDAADARFVAGMLDIPFYVLNFKPDFDRLIDYFADEYAAGRTPNPCVQCNTWLKFGKLVDYADMLGCEFVATGHYARLDRTDGHTRLRRGIDRSKDQSYFLFGVRPEMLDRAMFPIGHLQKSEVRSEAARFNLPVHNKPDSVEICFVPDRDYARVVRERRPDAFRSGSIEDDEGNRLGTHEGVANFTIGQRRGLKVAAGKPMYVTRLDVVSNTVTLGERDALMHRSLVATDANFVSAMPKDAFRCQAQIRYQHDAADCTATARPDGELCITFDEAQSAITPGQAVVLYNDDEVIGGGWIDRTVESAPPTA